MSDAVRVALEQLVCDAAGYSPRYDHDWRCEIRTAAAGWKAGDPPVIRCECGRVELDAALEQARAALSGNTKP